MHFRFGRTGGLRVPARAAVRVRGCSHGSPAAPRAAHTVGHRGGIEPPSRVGPAARRGTHRRQCRGEHRPHSWPRRRIRSLTMAAVSPLHDAPEPRRRPDREARPLERRSRTTNGTRTSARTGEGTLAARPHVLVTDQFPHRVSGHRPGRGHASPMRCICRAASRTGYRTAAEIELIRRARRERLRRLNVLHRRAEARTHSVVDEDDQSELRHDETGAPSRRIRPEKRPLQRRRVVRDAIAAGSLRPLKHPRRPQMAPHVRNCRSDAVAGVRLASSPRAASCCSAC